MAYKTMEPSDNYKPGGAQVAGEYTETEVSTGATAHDPIILPLWAKWVAAQLVQAGAATSIVQATCSTISAVKAGTASWLDWTTGASTGGAVKQGSISGPISAIRVNITGASPATTYTLSIQARG